MRLQKFVFWLPTALATFLSNCAPTSLGGPAQSVSASFSVTEDDGSPSVDPNSCYFLHAYSTTDKRLQRSPLSPPVSSQPSCQITPATVGVFSDLFAAGTNSISMLVPIANDVKFDLLALKKKSALIPFGPDNCSDYHVEYLDRQSGVPRLALRHRSDPNKDLVENFADNKLLDIEAHSRGETQEIHIGSNSIPLERTRLGGAYLPAYRTPNCDSTRASAQATVDAVEPTTLEFTLSGTCTPVTDTQYAVTTQYAGALKILTSFVCPPSGAFNQTISLPGGADLDQDWPLSVQPLTQGTTGFALANFVVHQRFCADSIRTQTTPVRAANVTHICTADQLAHLAAATTNITLHEDLDLQDQPFTPIQNFSGEFAGNSHEIKNLKLACPATTGLDVGLFSGFKDNTQIHDLRLTKVTAATGCNHPATYFGALIGVLNSNYAQTVSIRDVVANGVAAQTAVNGQGGLIGLILATINSLAVSITHSQVNQLSLSDPQSSGSTAQGGLVAVITPTASRVLNVAIDRASAAGTLQAATSCQTADFCPTGGLIGQINNVASGAGSGITIQDSYTDITATSANNHLGGFLGRVQLTNSPILPLTLTRVFAAGVVTASITATSGLFIGSLAPTSGALTVSASADMGSVGVGGGTISLVGGAVILTGLTKISGHASVSSPPFNNWDFQHVWQWVGDAPTLR